MRQASSVGPWTRRRRMSPATSSWLIVERDEGAVVDPLEQDLVGPGELVRAQHVAVVGAAPGCCRRAYRRSWLLSPGSARPGPHLGVGAVLGVVAPGRARRRDSSRRASSRGRRGRSRRAVHAVRPAPRVRERVLVGAVEVVDDRAAARPAARAPPGSHSPRSRAGRCRPRSRPHLVVVGRAVRGGRVGEGRRPRACDGAHETLAVRGSSAVQLVARHLRSRRRRQAPPGEGDLGVTGGRLQVLGAREGGVAALRSCVRRSRRRGRSCRASRRPT